MRNILAINLIAITLCGCQSAEENKQEWISFCVQGEFTAKQCEVLYSLKQSSDSASSNANTAAAMSGVAMGMSAASIGRR